MTVNGTGEHTTEVAWGLKGSKSSDVLVVT